MSILAKLGCWVLRNPFDEPPLLWGLVSDQGLASVWQKEEDERGRKGQQVHRRERERENYYGQLLHSRASPTAQAINCLSMSLDVLIY